MLKLAVGALVAGLILLLLIGITGHLVWDNRLLWAPPALFSIATCVGLGGLDHEEHRATLLLTGAVSFCCILGYAVFYFFLFGLVGH